MHYLVVGLSHKTAPLPIRERLALPEDKIPLFLKELLGFEDILEGMLISTCNRVEVTLVCRHTERGGEIVRQLLARATGFDEAELEKFLYMKVDQEGIAHFFRVTAGLDSMVIGEPQIGGQVKSAYTQAVEADATGTYLNKLVHRALNVSKKIRTETEIGAHPVSVSYAAVLMAEKIFGNLAEKSVLVIGAGEMSELALQYLKERGVIQVLIANRSRERALEMARRFGGEVIDLASIAENLERVDVVLSSVESPSLITEEMVSGAMGRRKGRSIFFIDIGVPRNIDPGVNRVENIYLYNIDDLKGVVESNLKQRNREGHRAEGIVLREVASFLNYLREREVSPTIEQLAKKLERIRERELGRFFKNGSITTKQREEIEACTRAIVNKILHDPIILMKTEQLKEGGSRYAEILRKLFKLEGES